MKPAAGVHVPVLLEETLEIMAVRAGGRYLDGTLGLGGHAAEILSRAGSGAELLGLDRDSQALELARQRLAGFGPAAHLAKRAFADFEAELDLLGWDFIDGALLDLGVSSLQLDTPERGFSFLRDGPLDMRMDAQKGEGAAALLNRLSEEKLRKLIVDFGEEPQAGRIARAIIRARAEKPLESTLELAGIVSAAYPPKWRNTSRNHPATRTFQALRLAVNGELEQLGLFLERIIPRLSMGGRVVIISFHSLEDRMVKHFFREASKGCICPPQARRCVCGHEALLRILAKRAIRAGAAESEANPRARSARLRAAERAGKPLSRAGAAENPARQGDGRAGACRGNGYI
ncbi:MAG: 16S rRNA (cytosine(1402)-N(4))-methyltransferase RsmH [Deltaproteobacteria bacterium]|jgi:16S rRNA (cytosine1402-N4)-methyltransferase|nr:16S rRNA (cytosine(1402)-N(4))-methyltransferase RsmH [Deltaproteobacteria bacterium]